ncbi:MAG: ferritin [Bacteroidetes bacterium]|jgi:ferritin|nr:ferritin [Bacteroidota bacterium]
MLSKKVEAALNKQIELEAASSNYYLSMASWAETQGLNGVANFLYGHSDEERMHSMKLIRFVNERGGHGLVPALKAPPAKYKSVNEVFETVLHHEEKVSQSINELVDLCLKEKDYSTHNFLQWYVTEQIEEEALARTSVDKLKFMGGEKAALYFFDRDMAAHATAAATSSTPKGME